jgi:hypothetical protein
MSENLDENEPLTFAGLKVLPAGLVTVGSFYLYLAAYPKEAA